jgi:hypothetical protein
MPEIGGTGIKKGRTVMGTPRLRIGFGGHQELGGVTTFCFVAEQFRQHRYGANSVTSSLF